MMMRVKLVIISSSDGSTVSRLIRTRIWRDRLKGRPSPPISFTARLTPSAARAPPADAEQRHEIRRASREERGCPAELNSAGRLYSKSKNTVVNILFRHQHA